MANDAKLEDVKPGETLLDLASVENLSFDDMEEAPGFVNPPDGIYDLLLSSAKIEKYTTKDTPEKKGGEQNRIAHYYDVVEIVELSNPKEQKPPIGAKFSERFQLNDNGLKYWKSKAKSILGEGIQGSNLTLANVIKELNAGTYRFRARVKQKITEGKGSSKGKTFTNIQVQVIAGEAQPELEGGEVTTDEAKV